MTTAPQKFDQARDAGCARGAFRSSLARNASERFDDPDYVARLQPAPLSLPREIRESGQ